MSAMPQSEITAPGAAAKPAHQFRRGTWRPGQSGNPAGRPNVGASWMEWVESLGHQPPHQVRKVLADRTATAVKRAAAVDVIQWQAMPRTRSGEVARGRAADRILDRILGKAAQRIELAVTQVSVNVSAVESIDVNRSYTGAEVLAMLSQALMPAKRVESQVIEGETIALPAPAEQG